MNRGGQRTLKLREQFFDAIHDGDDIRAGLPLNIQNDGGIFIGPRRLAYIFRAVNNGSHVGEPHRPAIAIGDDDGFVTVAGDQLVVGADGVSLLRTVKSALGLIHVGLAEGSAKIF